MNGNQETVERLPQIAAPQLQKDTPAVPPVGAKESQQVCSNGICKITWKPVQPRR